MKCQLSAVAMVIATLTCLNAAEPNDWPEGRGFEVGQTLPDIPLINMEGDEVRFDQFLGKRYIVYCWASW